MDPINVFEYESIARSLAHPEGECGTAQAAGRANTLMIVSTTATRSIEEIAQAASGPLWFQLYVYPSLEFAEELVRRAESAGYRAIVLTVDLPVHESHFTVLEGTNFV